MASVDERLSERLKRLAILGAERALARKERMIDYFGAGGQELTEAQQAEMYDAMQNDPSGVAELMQGAIRRAQRPYRSLRGTAGIPRAFVEWDKREWAKRQKQALDEQAEEMTEEPQEE